MIRATGRATIVKYGFFQYWRRNDLMQVAIRPVEAQYIGNLFSVVHLNLNKIVIANGVVRETSLTKKSDSSNNVLFIGFLPFFEI
jgi:hypothetical protein